MSIDDKFGYNGPLPYDQQRFEDLQHQAKASSFSGSDIVATIVMPRPSTNDDGGQGPYGQRQSIAVTGEMQTITVSSARSVSPVRTLGTVAPPAFTRGGRTIAGTMIFSNLLRDAFIDHYQQGRDSGETDFDGFFVDQIPRFDVVLSAANEYGAVANAVLKGVTISNFGTTMSVDDMYMESTYTYVAEQFWPFVEDTAKVKRLLSGGVEGENKASNEVISRFFKMFNNGLTEDFVTTTPASQTFGFGAPPLTAVGGTVKGYGYDNIYFDQYLDEVNKKVKAYEEARRASGSTDPYDRPLKSKFDLDSEQFRKARLSGNYEGFYFGDVNYGDV